MKPVAEELSKIFGVVEPLQTANSVDGQIKELKKIIEEKATSPVYLIGWSWGAWLSYLLTAKYPKLVKKLILVSSGPFEASYASQIMKTRLERLTKRERKRVQEIIRQLQSGKANDTIFNEFGSLMNKADSFKPIPNRKDNDLKDLIDIKKQSEIYKKIWPEAEGFRKNGKLLECGKSIICPVIAIHGDYDPHSAEGVEKPLSSILKDFHFYLFKHCGHHPWLEQEAKDQFYEILTQELKS